MQSDSPEFPVGQGHGYLWRLSNYWRLEEEDGGVYMQVESIALSRDVPAIFAWFVNPLIRRVSHRPEVPLHRVHSNREDVTEAQVFGLFREHGGEHA